jgi:hypothetical protein
MDPLLFRTGRNFANKNEFVNKNMSRYLVNTKGYFVERVLVV